MAKKKILIIDDEVDIVELVKTRLELDNYYVMPCYSSKRGLEIVKREKPDLILLDIMMPDLDGYEVCKILKADSDTKNIPVILFTAKQEEAKIIQDKCLELGADDYILKPYDPIALLSKVKFILRSKQGNNL